MTMFSFFRTMNMHRSNGVGSISVFTYSVSHSVEKSHVVQQTTCAERQSIVKKNL